MHDRLSHALVHLCKVLARACLARACQANALFFRTQTPWSLSLCWEAKECQAQRGCQAKAPKDTERCRTRSLPECRSLRFTMCACAHSWRRTALSDNWPNGQRSLRLDRARLCRNMSKLTFLIMSCAERDAFAPPELANKRHW